MIQPLILTKQGYSKLKQRLKFLEQVERKKIAKDIKETQSFGDISENAEFEEARNRQTLLEQEIAELKNIVAQAKIVTKNNYGGKITIGSKIKISLGGTIKTIEIVGDREANPLKGKISYRSPWGQAVLGKQKGEKVKVKSPSGSKTIRILEVS